MAKPKTPAKSKRPAKTKASSKPARAAKTKAPRTPPRAAKKPPRAAKKPEPQRAARTWNLAILYPSGAYVEKHYQTAGSVDSPEEVADLYREERKLPDEVRVALILDERE
jgi:hypothetical protein